MKARAPKKVLVVDDEVETTRLLTSMLDLSGFTPIRAYDGDQALEIARTVLPRAILLDVMMPTVDGFEVARQLRADPLTRNIGIVLVTAYGSDDLHERSREAGADVVLRKPVGMGQIIGAVSQVIGKYRSRYDAQFGL